MPNPKTYWSEIRALETSLPDFVWLMSLHNPAKGQHGGSLSQVSAAVAARLLHASSHRLASDEETQTHLAQQETVRREAFRQRLHRQGVAIVPLTPPLTSAPVNRGPKN